MQAPPLIETTPPRTLVLYGDNHDMWSVLLPQMTPVCRWVDETGRIIVRWEMPKDLAEIVGLDSNSGCSNPGCECGDRVLEIVGGFLVDTNWRHVGWFFSG